MAYNIICNGTFTVQTITGNIPLGVNISVGLTGSNWVAKATDIGTSSWVGLDTSSLADLRYFAADNIGSGNIQIATDSAGTKIISILQPNDNCIIPWSGSVSTSTLFAKAFITGSTLAYMALES